MKLQHLFLKNIGAFNGEAEIDFSKLGEIFLISGNTGSGKTTIFDAVTFALYGKLPGSRSQLDLKRFRSDFCSNEDEAYVILIFSINDQKYKIARTLPVQYTTRNNTKSQKLGSVVLYKNEIPPSTGGELDFTENTEWVILSDGTEEVKKLIETLIGLNRDEFTRIVLLPQGEFADFLKLSSNERKEALGKLFPIELYKAIIEKAKEKSIFYKNKIEDVKNKIIDLRSIYDEDQYKSLQKALTTSLEELTIRKKALSEQLNKTYEQRQHLKNIVLEIENRVTIEQAQEKLLTKQNEIEGLDKIAHKAKQALSLQSEIRSVQTAKINYDEEEKRFLQSKTKLEQTEKELSLLFAQKQTFAEHENTRKQLNLALVDIKTAQQNSQDFLLLNKKYEQNIMQQEKTAKEIQAIKEEINRCEKKIEMYNREGNNLGLVFEEKTRIQKDYTEAKNTVEQCQNKEHFKTEIELLCARIKDIDQEIQNRTQTIEHAKASLTDFESELIQVSLENEAAKLAKKLEEGKPCPVCGSSSHPRIASTATHTAPLEDKIASQKQLLSEAENNLQSKKVEQALIQGKLESTQKNDNLIQTKLSLKEADTILEKLKKQLIDAENDYNKAQTSIESKKREEENLNQLRKKLEPLDTIREEVKKEIALAEQELNRLEESFNNLIFSHQILCNGEYPQNTVNIKTFDSNLVFTIQNNIDTLTKNIESFETSLSEYTEENSKLKAKNEEIEKNLIKRKEECENTHKNLNDAITKTDFSSSEEALNALLKEEQIKEIEDEIISWHKEKDKNASLIENSLKHYPQNLEKTKNSLLDCTDKITEIEKTIQTIEDDITEKQKELNEQENHAKNLNDLNHEFDTLQKDGEQYITLSNVISGINPKKTPLDAWVLSLYLEEITSHASSRLNRISDGRYTLHLKTDDTGGKDKIKGLDLEIFDSFTGKKRPCATLSGGETFMASISLALALTDVVQSKAGGITLDSLFIDEGFGSLDDATLEKALSILDEIREKRMVGLISHVGDLKSRISSQIVISKGPSGSSIKVYT